MKLFCSLTSPYARKVRVALREAGLEARVEEVVVDPWTSPTELLDGNPLCKVPALRTDEGLTLPDSALILDYLGSLDVRLVPAGSMRWETARLTQLADGIIDANVNIVIEKRRPPALISADWLARQQAAIVRALDALEPLMSTRELPDFPDLFQITLGCALAHLDFRNQALAWRTQRPQLAQWFESFAQRSSMTGTQPPA